MGPALSLAQGSTATLSLQAENIPGGVPVTVKDLPSGVTVDSRSRENNQIALILKADSKTPLGTFEISAEAKVRDRWIYTEAIEEPHALLRDPIEGVAIQQGHRDTIRGAGIARSVNACAAVELVVAGPAHKRVVA